MKLRTVALAAALVLPGCNCGSGSDPVITTFTATPSNLPVDGGTVTLAWAVNGATSLSISPGVGAVTPVVAGNTTALVTSNTTFALTATDSNGSVTQTASVCVASGPVTATATSPDTYTVCNSPFMTQIVLKNGSCETVSVTAADGTSPSGDCALNGNYTNLTTSVAAGATGTVFNLTNGTICCAPGTVSCSISCTDTMNWTLTTSAGPITTSSNQFSVELSGCSNQACP